MLRLFRETGQRAVAFFAAAGLVASFSGRSIWATLRSREGLSLTAVQTLVLSRRCLVPVALVVGPVAAMIGMQALALTRAFGVERLLSPLLAATVVRELAPGFASVMVCFQAGAGIAAELGTMRVSEELDALEVMGLDPRVLVVGPRILGATLTAMLLNAFGIVLGIYATYLSAVTLLEMPEALFVQRLWDVVTPSDVWLSEGKCLIFGLGLGSVATTFGFHASGGPVGVGRAANRAVVTSVIFVLVANYVLNSLVFGIGGGSVG